MATVTCLTGQVPQSVIGIGYSGVAVVVMGGLIFRQLSAVAPHILVSDIIVVVISIGGFWIFTGFFLG